MNYELKQQVFLDEIIKYNSLVKLSTANLDNFSLMIKLQNDVDFAKLNEYLILANKVDFNIKAISGRFYFDLNDYLIVIALETQKNAVKNDAKHNYLLDLQIKHSLLLESARMDYSMFLRTILV